MSIVTTKARPATDREDDSYFERMGNTRQSRFRRHLLLCVVGIVMMYPLAWLVSSSVKPNSLIFKDLSLWPAQWNLSNYTDGWNALQQPFSIYLVNSAVIVVLSIVGNLLSCSLAAYGFARLDFGGRKLF